MSEQTNLLNMPYILPSQAQKHVTHNEALRMLDAVLHLRVDGIGRDAPPESPEEGERHAVGDAPAGAFAGHAGEIAAFQDGAWAFFPPREGWLLWDAAGEALHVFHEGNWVEAVPAPDRLQQLGIATDADGVNRLAVAAHATLLTHAGAGHQLKVNKAAAGDTASLLFQTDWSGRAEMGLAGNDDFSVKVSPDGAAWKTALRVRAADGFVGIGTTEARYLLTVGQPGTPDGTPHFDKSIGISGAGAAYFRGEDTVNNIRFLMGTSTSGYVLLASMSNHPFVIRVNNSVEAMRIAASGQIGIGTTVPHASALLDVAGTARGFLPPRMTTTQRDAIAAPAEGLMVYNSTDHEPQFWDGSQWRSMAA
ncbi:DUF2793 domain-containing protein [Shinella pollutisoli]|uniref:DUF2793 domain-containing protein n=1 Tax=Shinella pollutisoli TaxID=2250594 RepID=A0ABV7DHA2_9HYPH|nr:DUF2793 domain-containing protein [Shinella pollutisoli]